MHITLDAEKIITLVSVVTAVIALFKYYNKGHKWFMKQEEQETEIQSIKDEQEILTKGILACLKGLSQQGCNGPVTSAIEEIEEHLNEKAHD